MNQCPNQPGYYRNGASREPAFSPDGIRIAFVSDRDSDKLELYAMSAVDGSGMTRLTNNTVRDDSPDWAPASPTCAIAGTNGDDTLTGTPGNDVICGFAGNNRMDGGGGDDVVLGGTGNDTLIATEGRDTLNGGPDKDTASFVDSSASFEASLVTGFARRVGTDPAEGVALAGIESLTGSALDDTLSGSAGANVLVGRKGNDELLGFAGNDKLDSRDGIKNDSVNGGLGTDRCSTDRREVSIRGCE
jgi:Ca2+-binding RTX toxin-like protein